MQQTLRAGGIHRRIEPQAGLVPRMIVANPPPSLRQEAKSDTWRIRIQGIGSRIPPTAAGLCSGAEAVRSDFSKEGFGLSEWSDNTSRRTDKAM